MGERKRVENSNANPFVLIARRNPPSNPALLLAHPPCVFFDTRAELMATTFGLRLMMDGSLT